jgi:glutamyl-tRNA synthetase
MTGSTRVRFAPSPTGHLHIGGARTALFNWLFARHTGGTFILRIEDTDTARSTAESEKAVLQDLEWLGLSWDEGPGAGGDRGPYRQSERREIYREQAERLLEEGKAFRCYCTDGELEAKRKDALARGLVPQYDGTCRGISPEDEERLRSEGRPPVVRLYGPTEDIAFEDLVRGAVEFGKDMLGDFVIMRSDGRPTYNFAVVVDDALMDISHVIRAEEHLSNTMRQILVYRALGFEPPTFVHVSLIVDKDRSKLSKRRGATSVAEFREQGFLPGGIVNYLALLGWSHPEAAEILTREQLVGAFELDRVSPSPAAFDEDKLSWVNAHHIREEPLERVADLARPFAEGAGFVEADAARFAQMVDLVRDGIERLSDIPDEIAIFFEDGLEFETEARDWVEGEVGARVVQALHSAVERETAALAPETFKSILKGVGKELGVKGKDLFMPARAALTGRTHGPALGDVAATLGRELALARLSSAAGKEARR